MRRADLIAFIRSHKYAVQASISPDGRPQAAVVGIAVSDDFEIVFDTLDTARKAMNLDANARIAFVIGGTTDGDERTMQYEGVAERPSGAARDAALALYFSVFPEGRSRLSWRGIAHFQVTPTWIRYSDYNANPPVIVELSAEEIHALA